MGATERLRQVRRRWSASASPLKRGAARLMTAAVKALRLLLDARFRSEALTRAQHGERHFQGASFTRSDRFPALFQQCALSLQGIAAPRVLSFGCSTGEEVFSLAHYLPNAEIVGVDINRWCVKQAAVRNTSSRLRFLYRGSPEFDTLGTFDAIFCMAVFQRTENRSMEGSVIETGFRFENFEAEMRGLDPMLKPGGLLFIDQCDFSFEQTAVAAEYQPLVCAANEKLRQRRLFGRDNRLLTEAYVAKRIFVKRAAIVISA